MQADSPIGEELVWVRVESLETPELRLAMTEESARALMDALQTTLSRLS